MLPCPSAKSITLQIERYETFNLVSLRRVISNWIPRITPWNVEPKVLIKTAKCSIIYRPVISRNHNPKGRRTLWTVRWFCFTSYATNIVFQWWFISCLVYWLDSSWFVPHTRRVFLHDEWTSFRKFETCWLQKYWFASLVDLHTHLQPFLFSII